MDENKPADSNEGEIINVKVTPPEEAAETNDEPKSFIPTVEAAGDPPADEERAPAAEIPAPAPEAPAVADSPAEANPEPETQQPATHEEHKAGAPIAAIIAAVLVALGLAAVTVYAYMKQQNENRPQPTTNTVQQDDTAEDFNQATEEIDEALEASDEADFSESELTDESLGL